jgi:hypothetical protein
LPDFRTICPPSTPAEARYSSSLRMECLARLICPVHTIYLQMFCLGSELREKAKTLRQS